VAIKPCTPNRFGTNLLTVAEAEAVLAPIVSTVAEDAFRAGFAAAEEVLGAHGSDRLLAAIETAWAGYADDNALAA
jgi:transcriptional regulatory protein LevR